MYLDQINNNGDKYNVNKSQKNKNLQVESDREMAITIFENELRESDQKETQNENNDSTEKLNKDIDCIERILKEYNTYLLTGATFEHNNHPHKKLQTTKKSIAIANIEDNLEDLKRNCGNNELQFNTYIKNLPEIVQQIWDHKKNTLLQNYHRFEGLDD